MCNMVNWKRYIPYQQLIVQYVENIVFHKNYRWPIDRQIIEVMQDSRIPLLIKQAKVPTISNDFSQKIV